MIGFTTSAGKRCRIPQEVGVAKQHGSHESLGQLIYPPQRSCNMRYLKHTHRETLQTIKTLKNSFLSFGFIEKMQDPFWLYHCPYSSINPVVFPFIPNQDEL